MAGVAHEMSFLYSVKFFYANTSLNVFSAEIYLFLSLPLSEERGAPSDQTEKPTNYLQPVAAMTDGVLGNLKEQNGGDHEFWKLS